MANLWANADLYPGEDLLQLTDRYLKAHKEFLSEHSDLPQEPSKYENFYQFKNESGAYEGHVRQVKERVLEDTKLAAFDLTPGRYNKFRDQVGTFVDNLIDILAHLEKASTTPFNVHNNPLDRKMDMFIPKLNDLLAKL